MSFRPGLRRRDVLIAMSALGAGALALNHERLDYIRFLGGGSDHEFGPLRLQSIDNLRFSYFLPELFHFNSYARHDPGGTSTTVYAPRDGEACKQAYLSGCPYTNTVTLAHREVPSDMYLAGLGGHYCPLMVPPADAKNKICVIAPDHTYRAYNRFGGLGLYDQELYDVHGYENGNRPYFRLSWYNNPIKQNIYSYLRRHAFDYDVVSHDYAELNGNALDGYKLLILYGHDEYWTEKFRRGVERHLLEGGHLLNLSGNTCYWRVRLDGDLMRLTRRGGADLWAVIDPEEKVLGTRFRSAGYSLAMRFRDDETGLRNILGRLRHPDLPQSMSFKALKQRLAGMRLLDVSHPIFEGTGLKPGEWIGTSSRILPPEFDGVPLLENSSVDWAEAEHVPRDLRIFAEAWGVWPQRGPHERVRHAGTMVEFKYRGQGTVLGFPTAGWARALYRGDEEIVAITNNAIRFLLHG